MPGQVKTRLCPPLTTDEAAALYEAFLRQIVRPVKGAATFVYGWPGDGLGTIAAALEPALVAGPAPLVELRAQTGGDLWARMAGCFDELFAAGHSPILIRNTDSPDLEIDVVEGALRSCGPGRVVLGPDQGGGYYLVALAEPCPGLFAAGAEGDDSEDIVEGADTVFAATVRRARRLGLEVVVLPERADVDTFEDLVAMWRGRMAGD